MNGLLRETYTDEILKLSNPIVLSVDFTTSLGSVGVILEFSVWDVDPTELSHLPTQDQ